MSPPPEPAVEEEEEEEEEGPRASDVKPPGLKLTRSETFREEQNICFTDADNRRLAFELTRAGVFNFYVEGRQKISKANRVRAEDHTLKIDGKRILSSACSARVPAGQEHLLEEVMEMFGQRRIENRPPLGPAPLKITVVSAQGLRQADDFSKSDPYCFVQVEGKPKSKFATYVVDNNQSPAWNHMDEIWDYEEGDTLLFKVYDKDWLSRDDHLGWARLVIDKEVLPLFECVLALNDAGVGVNASLKVRISWGTRSERQFLLRQREARRALVAVVQRAAQRSLVCSLCPSGSPASRCDHEPSAEQRRTFEELQAAVNEAKFCELAESDYREAASILATWRDVIAKRATLKRENDVLRQRLRDVAAAVAERRCSKGELKEALAAGRAAGLEVELGLVLKEVRGLLAFARTLSLTELEQVVALAKAAGLSKEETAEAEKALAKERRREEARALIQEACRECSMEKLEEAICLAKEVGLRESEWEEALELVNRGEAALRRERVKKKLDAACSDYKKLPDAYAPESPEAAKRRAKIIENLERCLKDAKAADIAPESIQRGERLLLKEQQRKALEALALVSGQYEALYTKAEKALKRMRKEGVEPDEELRKAMLEARDKLKDAIAVARSLKVDEDAFGLRPAETMRKRLHNMLEDLKGAIRVICRVRPLNDKEMIDGETDIAQRFDLCTLEVTQELNNLRPGVVAALASYERGEGEAPTAEKSSFHFDAVFAPGSQDDIFQDCAELVQSALDGYNVTLFAYGQTGSGKTHTMFGEGGCPGLAPRTVDELYSIMEKTKEDFEYEVSATVVELYCDMLVDLLVDQKRLQIGENGYPTSGDKSKDPVIKHERDGTITVTNLTSRPCKSAKDLHDILSVGAANREVSKTYKNDRSSRSHLVSSIRITITDRRDRDKPISGKIILCDLAGSERTKHFPSGMSKEKQLREANEINKSLAALADVIKALVARGEHVPYRNHKLTQLLQDSLGGTAKALMFVNCSPASGSRGETLSSLNWATAAKGITNQFNAAHLAQLQGGDHKGSPKGSPRSSPRGSLRPVSPRPGSLRKA